MDNIEILGAGAALAVVPFSARAVVIKPLCSWLTSCGQIFFEEHLREPVLELQWALGWLLAEAFTVTKFNVQTEEDTETLKGLTLDLRHFFTLLPKLDRHGAPMLSLAVEAVVESGLWRRCVLKPIDDGSKHFERDISWPQLFNFAHERLPPEMRFRLWRCALQLCVTSPTLAPFAEVPHTLVALDAPPGAAELVHDALALGADSAALAPLKARFRGATGSGVLRSRAEGEAAEATQRQGLAEIGVDVNTWSPGVEAPTKAPPHHRMRAGGRYGRRAPKTTQDVNKGVEPMESAPTASAPAASAPLPTASATNDTQVHEPELPEVKRRRRKGKEA